MAATKAPAIFKGKDPNIRTREEIKTMEENSKVTALHETAAKLEETYDKSLRICFGNFYVTPVRFMTILW